MKLTAAKVRELNTPGKYHDQHGLILRVAPGGSKQWLWRGTVFGRRRDLGLGSVVYVTLREARDQAFEYRRIARAGGDPAALRRGSSVPTFAEAVEAVVEGHRAGWTNARSEENWRRALASYACPSLGKTPVDQITTSDLARVLRPIWFDKPATARKLRTHLGMVMRWAIAEGHRTDDPAGPALTAAMPRHTAPVEHHRSLPYGDIPAALAVVDGSDAWPGSKACLRFTVATACRSGESRLAQWSEIDADAAVWTIPADRAKTGRPLAVPLSSAALAALDTARPLSGGSGLIFAGSSGRALTDSGLSALLRDNRIAGTVHGFRASFRSWCAEQGVNREVAEAALGHVASKVERSYQRSNLLDARRAVMQAWADAIG